MKILMTADAVGGVWSYALSLADGLEPHGAEIVLAVMGDAPTTAQRADAAARRNVVLHEADYRLEWMADPWQDVAAAGEWLLDIAARERPDIVHLNGYVHAALPWTAPVLVVAHSCVLSWWRAVHGSTAPAEWRQYREAVAAGVHAARTVVAPTRAMLECIARDYGVPADGRVIMNGADADPLPLGSRNAFGGYGAARLPEPLVLGAGRVWDESKNLRSLAAAAPSIRWPVCIAGSCTHPAGGRLDLPGVHLPGPIAPAVLRSWYRRASIFVHPALYEPFGLAPLEAALATTALVLGDIPSLREVWGDAALYVPPRDPAAIAGMVNALIADPLLLARHAAAARQRALALSVRRMARAYHTLYRELATARLPQAVEALACAS